MYIECIVFLNFFVFCGGRLIIHMVCIHEEPDDVSCQHAEFQSYTSPCKFEQVLPSSSINEPCLRRRQRPESDTQTFSLFDLTSAHSETAHMCVFTVINRNIYSKSCSMKQTI